jgi:hypothetical protein
MIIVLFHGLVIATEFAKINTTKMVMMVLLLSPDDARITNQFSAGLKWSIQYWQYSASNRF